jgi:hypothetical protein
MSRLFQNAFYRGFVLLMFYLAVAAAAYNGFYTKWQLNDGNGAMSLAALMNGTGERPFLYRNLVPTIANAVDASLPAATSERLVKRLTDPARLDSRWGLARGNPQSESLHPDLAIRYFFVYYLTYCVFVGALFLFRALCLQAGVSRAAATAAPALVALLFPFLQSEGGYYYDFVELFFLFLAVWLTGVRGVGNLQRFVLLLLVTAFATWNKESFFFFLPALYPLLRRHCSWRAAGAAVLALMFASGCVYLRVRAEFAGAPGSTMDVQFWLNLRWYSDLGNWFRSEATYGIILPCSFSVFFLVIAAGIVVLGRSRLAPELRRHGIIALAVNAPLFALFVAPGEMRDASLVYPAFFLLLACAIDRWLRVESGYTPPLPAL